MSLTEVGLVGWVGSALGEGRGALNPEAQARPAVLGAAAAAAAGPPVLVISGNHLRGREACFSCGTNSHLHVPSGAKFAPNESLGQKLRRSPSHLPGGGGGSGPASPGSGLRDLHRAAPSPPPSAGPLAKAGPLVPPQMRTRTQAGSG